MAIINIMYVVMLIFGILQIILFFKVWGMTNDVRRMRDLYEKRSDDLYSLADKLLYAVKKLDKQDEPIKEQKRNIEVQSNIVKEEYKQDITPKVKKPLPVIDENSDEFKQRLRKWKILKTKGFTEQAVKEYMEYTKLDNDSATRFINSI